MKDLYFIYPYLFRVYQLKQLNNILAKTPYISKRPLNKMNNEIKIVMKIIDDLNLENVNHKFHLNKNTTLKKYAKIIGVKFADLIYYEIINKLR